jgi:hypothetical protein
MQKLIEFISELTANPVKSLVTTASGATAGSLIDIKMHLLQVQELMPFEVWLRDGVWIITGLVGFCTIFSTVDKYVTKFKNRKK